MRLIIVDDEHLARALLREYLASEPGIEIVAECANGFEAVKAITELAPDLVLLDIQMPKLNGFEVVELASGREGPTPHYIFVTAFDQYALKAFEVHALDYLLKPFPRERLQQALKHARERLAPPVAKADSPSQNVAALLHDVASQPGLLDRILIRDGSRVQVIALDKVDYIEAQDDYIAIRSEGKSWLKSQRLSELETRLDARRFVRIHRSWIVNIESVARIEASSKDSHVAVLRDGSKLPISRSGYQKVRGLVG